MLSSLAGTIADLTPEGLVTVQAGPVGVDVLVPKSLIGSLRRGAAVTFSTHLQVSDDALTLYGFASVTDRAFFRQLLGVSGVGPKSALSILALEPSAVRDAIVARDLATLSSIPGLGKKRAQRLLLELANVLAEDETPSPKRSTRRTPAHPLEAQLAPALEKLGYTPPEVKAMLAELPEEVTAPDAALQYLLKNAR